MKKLKLNMLVAFLANTIYILSGIVAQCFILRSFGSEINGLTGSVNQLLSYFTLLEAGLGTASVQALYKPLASDDREGVAGILSATSRQYKKVGLMFMGFVVLLAAAMPFVSNSSLNGWLVFILTLMMGTASAVNYLFIGRYQVLLRADGKVYILNVLDSSLGILFMVLRILMINLGRNIIEVQSVALMSPLLRIVVLRLYFRWKYPGYSYQAKPNYEAISKRKYVFVHQIVGMISNHIGVTILTVFATLSQVSVYSVYNLIYNNVRSIIASTFATAVEPSFGRLIGGDSSKVGQYYHYYAILFTFFLSWLLSAVLLMTVPFVWLYADGVDGIQYGDHVLAALFMLSVYIYLVRIPATMMVNVHGAFRETQRGAIIEAALNLLVSFPAFFAFGMRGLLLGSCVSVGYRVLDIQVYTYRHILHEKNRKWIRLFLINALAVTAFVMLMKASGLIWASGWIAWFLSGVICAVLGGVFFGLVFAVTYPREAGQVAGALMKKLKKA